MTHKAKRSGVVAALGATLLLATTAQAAGTRYAGLTRAESIQRAKVVVAYLSGRPVRSIPDPQIVRRAWYFDCPRPGGRGCPNSKRLAWYLGWRRDGKFDGCFYVNKRRVTIGGVTVNGRANGAPCRWR